MKSPDTGSIWLRRHLAEWRPVTHADYETLHALISEIEDYDNPPFRTTSGEVRDWLLGANGVGGTIGIAADGPKQGRPICYALVAGNDGTAECLARGGVDPDYRGRGFGAAVVLWQVQQGTLLLPKGGRILTHVSGDQEEFQEHLTRMGFIWNRTAYEVRRSLEDIPELPELPWGYEVVPWDEEWDGAARRLYLRLVSDGPTSDEWQLGQESVRPAWSFVALDLTGDRPDLAGFVRVSAYPNDWEALGWKEGYIDLLGVEDGRASSQLSRALVVKSMEAMRADGMDQVASGIGGASNEFVAGLYDDLGFRRSFETRTFSYQV